MAAVSWLHSIPYGMQGNAVVQHTPTAFLLRWGVTSSYRLMPSQQRRLTIAEEELVFVLAAPTVLALQPVYPCLESRVLKHRPLTRGSRTGSGRWMTVGRSPASHALGLQLGSGRRGGVSSTQPPYRRPRFPPDAAPGSAPVRRWFRQPFQRGTVLQHTASWTWDSPGACAAVA